MPKTKVNAKKAKPESRVKNRQADTVTLGKSGLTIEDVEQVAKHSMRVTIDLDNAKKLDGIRLKVEALANSGKPYYGINTGFGALSEKPIPVKELKMLQRNLVLSHAVGVGAPLNSAQSRALTFLRAHTLALGFSGCRSEIIKHLAALLNTGASPYVPARGSVGASGDLAPLAHLAMLLIGEGQAFIDDKPVSAKQALAHAKLKPLELQAKEGLSLINGTQAMQAVGCLALQDAKNLCDLADLIGACSTDALMGCDAPFDPRIHAARPHPGQMRSAAIIRELLHGSQIRESHRNCSRVQDPYSLRCMPQVHGATRDGLQHIEEVLEREINSATDNPLVFVAGKGIDILSGGNFHGQYLAVTLDYLAILVAELANISERRMELLLNPTQSSGLPPFLAKNAGTNSGFMMLQVTAAALINENKVLSHPASTDSIPTSAGREDHVSMGMTSALKAAQVVENVYQVLAIELIMACQGLELRKPLKSSAAIQKVLKRTRQEIAFAPQDRFWGEDLVRASNLCKSSELRRFILS